MYIRYAYVGQRGYTCMGRYRSGRSSGLQVHRYTGHQVHWSIGLQVSWSTGR